MPEVVIRFFAPARPPPRPDEVPLVVGDMFEGRKQVAAAFGGGEGGGGRGGGADECGDFLALFVNVGQTNRRYANEFWVEEVPGSNPTSRGVMMSWFPGGGGLREIASALVEAPSEEGVAEGSGKVSLGQENSSAVSAAGQGSVHVRRGLAPVRTRVSGEGRARVDFHLVDAPVLRERDPEAFSRLVDVGPEGFS